MSNRMEMMPEGGSGRPHAGDERKSTGTSGALSGMSGDLFRAYRIIIPLILLAMIVNTLSTVYDMRRGGHDIPLWEPALWEASSVVSILFATLIIYAATLLAPPAQTGWGKLLATNALATLPFSAIHTSGMFGLRWLVYQMDGAHYRVSAGDFLYEYRKDLLAYAIIYGAFRITARPQTAVPPVEAAPKPAEPLFDIVDGARTHRVPPASILSLRAAGNYVEFLLASGERPLMRGSLQDMQDRLTPHGFIRTHRSWAVNAARVRQIDAAGSGDFTLTLENGEEAPLSRRFPEALARLRGTPSEI